MRVTKAQVQNYRSIRDTGEFDIESVKTILVGPNEAGKTAVLQALQRLKPPLNIKPLNPLRDYPRAIYNDIATGKVKPAEIPVVTGWFSMDAEELKELPPGLDQEGNMFIVKRFLDNSLKYSCTISAPTPHFKSFKIDLLRLAAHMDRNDETKPAATGLNKLVGEWSDYATVKGKAATAVVAWLEGNVALIDEDNKKEIKRYEDLISQIRLWDQYTEACCRLYQRVPKFVLFSNIFRVRPNIHLEHLAIRLESNALDDEQYDYGNSCLLKLLGFTARQLSDLGKVG